MNVTSVDNFFFDELLSQLHPSDALVYLVIWRQSNGEGKPTVKISTGELARYTGLSMTTVQTSVKALLKARLLARRRTSATAVTEYQAKRPWRKKPTSPVPKKSG
jgi:DNA-binding MarR family transcriptional regulator